MDKQLELTGLIELFKVNFLEIKESIKDLTSTVKEWGETTQRNENQLVQLKTESELSIKQINNDVDRNFEQHREYYTRITQLETAKEKTSERHEQMIKSLQMLEEQIKDNMRGDVKDREIQEKKVEDLEKKVDEHIAWVKQIYFKASTGLVIVATAFGWIINKGFEYFTK